MSAASIAGVDSRFDLTKTGVDRDFIGFNPPPGHTTRNATDDSETGLAVIAIRNESVRARVALSYEMKGYRCVTSQPDWFSVSRRGEAAGSGSRFTVVTDDMDLMVDMRCREGLESMPIHAIIDDMHSVGLSPALVADELDVEVSEISRD